MAVRLRHIFFCGLISLFLYAFSASFLSSASLSRAKKPLYASKDPTRTIPIVTESYFNRRATVALSGEYQSSYDDFWAFLPSWKPHLLDAIDRYVDSSTIFFDAGAWEGPALFYGVQKAKFAIGLEPDPRAFEALKNHRDVSPDKDKIILIKECLSDREEMLKIAGNGERTSVVERVPLKFLDEKIRVGEHRVSKATCDTLPRYLAAKGVKGDAKVFIKMDLEGAEAFILPSLIEWVGNRPVKPVFFIGMHETLENASAEAVNKMMGFMRLFKYCGRELGQLEDCGKITLQTLKQAQDLILADYK